MDYSNYRLSLDVQAAGSGVVLSAKRGDTGRRLFVTLTDGGRPYTVGGDCYAVLTALKPDGHLVFNECTLEGNGICYTLREQLLAAPGPAKCELRLYGADAMLLTSASFEILVEETVYSDGDLIESFDDFSALTAIIGQSQQLRQQLLELKAQLETLKKELEGTGGAGGGGGGSSVTLSTVTLLASGWQGEASPYAQVVSIGGVTLYSRVDLQPDADQLAAFHHQALGLVAENEDGVVTVYAIGEKPGKDYTMQVSITEVAV